MKVTDNLNILLKTNKHCTTCKLSSIIFRIIRNSSEVVKLPGLWEKRACQSDIEPNSMWEWSGIPCAHSWSTKERKTFKSVKTNSSTNQTGKHHKTRGNTLRAITKWRHSNFNPPLLLQKVQFTDHLNYAIKQTLTSIVICECPFLIIQLQTYKNYCWQDN